MGDGFTKFHEYGMNERLTRQQRFISGEEGTWQSVTRYFDPYTARRSIYGWTNGFKWQIEIGEGGHFCADLSRTEAVLISTSNEGKQKFTDVYATSPEAMATVCIVLDRLEEDARQQFALGLKRDLIVGRLHQSFDTITQTVATFPSWERSLSREQRDDPLMKLLIEKYRAEYKESMKIQQEDVLTSICRLAKIYGVRYLSISATDLIVLEDVRTARRPFGKPMARELRDVLGIMGGVGNGSQAQISLHGFLPQDMFGTYFLGDDKPKRVAPHIPLRDADFEQIDRMYDGRVPLTMWLRLCGASGNSNW